MCRDCTESEIGRQRLVELDAAIQACKILQINPLIGGFFTSHAYAGRTPQYTEEQRAALDRYAAAKSAMKQLHNDYVFAVARMDAQRRLEQLRKPDYLMQYAEAYDSGDLDARIAIMAKVNEEPGLFTALSWFFTTIEKAPQHNFAVQIVQAMREQAHNS